MVTRTDVEEIPYHFTPIPQHSAAWRSAVRRRANVRVTVGLWIFNTVLLLADEITHMSGAVLRL